MSSSSSPIGYEQAELGSSQARELFVGEIRKIIAAHLSDWTFMTPVCKETAQTERLETACDNYMKEGSVNSAKLIDLVSKVVLQNEDMPEKIKLKLVKLLLPEIKRAISGERVKFATIIRTVCKIAMEEREGSASGASASRLSGKESREGRSKPDLAGILDLGEYELDEHMVIEDSSNLNWWSHKEARQAY